MNYAGQTDLSPLIPGRDLHRDQAVRKYRFGYGWSSQAMGLYFRFAIPSLTLSLLQSAESK